MEDKMDLKRIKEYEADLKDGKSKTYNHDEVMEELFKLDTTEIQKLRCLLDANGINYEVREWIGGDDVFWENYNLHVLNGDIRYSFLLSTGSYGREEGLIEFFNFSEEPTGWLTADECMKIIKEELKIEELEE